jgi:hypothetical protein
MSRLVIPRIVGVGQLAAEDVDRSPRDEYKERLVKYLPAESVAFYAFADKLLIDHYGLNTAGIAPTIPADAVLKFFSWLLIVLGLIGTPIYLHRQRVGNQPWRLHAAISTVAFVCWSYTLGGSFYLIHDLYQPLGAAMAAPIFTFVAGFFEPKAPKGTPPNVGPGQRQEPNPNSNPKVAS